MKYTSRRSEPQSCVPDAFYLVHFCSVTLLNEAKKSLQSQHLKNFPSLQPAKRHGIVFVQKSLVAKKAS